MRRRFGIRVAWDSLALLSGMHFFFSDSRWVSTFGWLVMCAVVWSGWERARARKNRSTATNAEKDRHTPRRITKGLRAE